MSTNENSGEIKRCPKTGRIISEPQKKKKLQGWQKWILPITGFISLIWFLIRVIPKPSRAKYPCMRVAAPAAAGFVTWILGILSFTVFMNKVKKLAKNAKYIQAITVGAMGIVCAVIFSASSITSTTNAGGTNEMPNSPVGVGKGIYPGRVTWVRDLNATTWDGSTGYWWEDKNTNQALVDGMVSSSIQSLSGVVSDAEAWDSIFKYFNQSHGKGNVGYNSNEKIAIKINCNNTRDSHTQQVNNINPSPQLILSVLKQLINTAGVPQQNIIIYDSTRYITDNIYNYCKSVFPNVVFLDQKGGDGRAATVLTDSPIIKYAKNNGCGDKIDKSVAQASYLIDMPIMKAHPLAGVTLSAKNHYGTVNGQDHGNFAAVDGYSPFVDIMGDKDIGGKTLLNVLDGLYGAKHSDVTPEKWSSKPFNGTWPASIFMSQDQVALDSVGFDFINTEMGSRMIPNSDAYLREEALADNPPSGVNYAPDGVKLTSLGVHEHWNNPDDKKYTKNLGTGSGIELVAIGNSDKAQVAAPTFNPLAGTYYIPQNVTISCSTPGAVIKYTTDGSIPTASSPTYNGSINVTGAATIKAFAINQGMIDSSVVSASYSIEELISPIPGKIEAEDYSAMYGIQTEGCSEGTRNIGYVNTDDWMDYKVNVTRAGTYTVSYRVSSPNTNGQIQLKNGSTILSVTNVPSTGGWQNWQTVTDTVKLTAGQQTLRVYAGGPDFNLNWISFQLDDSNNVKSTDVNNDGIVDVRDLAATSQAYNMKSSNTGFVENYDLNNDGIIDMYDMVIIAINIEK